MSLYSVIDKPKWLTDDQKTNTAASDRGWVYTRPDGHEEVLVAISRQLDKMVPTVYSVTTDKSSYIVGTDTKIDFTVKFQHPIKSSTITSSTTLGFLVDETPLSAAYSSKGTDTLVFRYTIPSNGTEYEILEVSTLGLDSITLNTGETVLLDYADENIEANLTLPSVVQSSISQRVPTISAITTDKSSYTLDTDTKIDFTVDFNRTVKSSGLTSATVLNFTIGEDSYEATYNSVSNGNVIFRYTFPGDTTDIEAASYLGLTGITLATDQYIVLASTNAPVETDNTMPYNFVVSAIVKP